jgi:hypothetical protein
VSNLPASARPYRVGLWMFVGLAVPLLALAFLGLKGTVPQFIGVAALTGFFTCLLLALFFGLRVRRLAMEERDRVAGSTMLVLMAGMLKDQDDATLERIADKEGPAGEAAWMLLERRRSDRS